MYINFWYPMAFGSELTDEPLKVRALGHDFVVFRDSGGNARCLANTCTHRGGSLAGGKVVGDTVRCPYHGWQFDGDGACRRLPSLGAAASIPGRIRTDAYPVEERYGLVFAFLGDAPAEERPPILEVAEYAAAGWCTTSQQFALQANYERSIENGLDPAHNEFVHDTHGMTRFDDMKVAANGPWGQGFWITFDAPKLQGDLKEYRDYVGDLQVGTGHMGANQLWTFIHVTPTNHIHQYAFERPIDESSTHIYNLTTRNFGLEDKMDKMIVERNQYVANQDIRVLQDLHPQLTPETNTHEFMVACDKVVVMYRELKREWDGRGWRIDADALARARGKAAFAIPSPARRQLKGWVLDPVPLRAPAAAAAASASRPGAA
jgi:phenylpropionate dioxygenase-like ring-hydroxylating dioxygenase large terminal subunit